MLSVNLFGGCLTPIVYMCSIPLRQKSFMRLVPEGDVILESEEVEEEVDGGDGEGDEK